MFGLSLQKLLVLVGVISAVIAAFALVSRMKRQRDELERMKARMPQQQAKRPAAAKSGRLEAEEMRACPSCGTYIAAGASTCGRAGCPNA